MDDKKLGKEASRKKRRKNKEIKKKERKDVRREQSFHENY